MGVVDITRNVSAEEGTDSSNGLAEVSCSRQPNPLRSGIPYHPEVV